MIRRAALALFLAPALLSCEEAITTPQPGSIYVLDRVSDHSLPWTYYVGGGEVGDPVVRRSVAGGSLEFFADNTVLIRSANRRQESTLSTTTCTEVRRPFRRVGNRLILDGAPEINTLYPGRGGRLEWPSYRVAPGIIATAQYRQGQPGYWNCS